MSFPPTYPYPNLQDAAGNRLHPGRHVLRRGGRSDFHPLLQGSLVWRVVESREHAGQLALKHYLDFTSPYEIVVTPALVRWVVVIDSAPLFGYEAWAATWLPWQEKGWFFWTERRPPYDELQLRAYDVQRNLQLRVSLNPLDAGELDYEALIWGEVQQEIQASYAPGWAPEQ